MERNLPTGRLGQQPPEDGEEESRDELQSDGNLPTRLALHAFGTQIDQRCNQLTQNDHQLNRCVHHATKFAGACFSQVYRYDDNHQARHAKVDNAADGELCSSGGRSLQGNAAGV